MIAIFAAPSASLSSVVESIRITKLYASDRLRGAESREYEIQFCVVGTVPPVLTDFAISAFPSLATDRARIFQLGVYSQLGEAMFVRAAIVVLSFVPISLLWHSNYQPRSPTRGILSLRPIVSNYLQQRVDLRNRSSGCAPDALAC